MPASEFQRSPGSPLIMGIVNVTPDSFSDGGRFHGTDAAVEHALRMLEEGADIIDIGGESTRPPGKDYGSGSENVSATQECERVLPVIRRILERQPDAVISIDTVKPEVAARAAEAGARIINDVSAGQFDPEILNVAAEFALPYILMHGHNPHDRKSVEEIHYQDVLTEVFDFLQEKTEEATQAGVHTVIADPGIGFAKTAAHSMLLLRELSRFSTLNVPLLVGASRKSFIGRELDGASTEERLFGTLGAHAAASLHGASIVRVHDVRPAREFFRLFAPLVG